jgi:hypothetical protein
MSDRPTRVVHTKVMRYVWDTGWSGGRATPPWPDRVFAEIFQADNGWSLRDYWRRCTFGHLEVDFDIGPWAVLPGVSHRELHADRRAIVAACRAQAAADRVPLEDFAHLIAFVHEPPCDTGPAGRDAVLDQAPVTLEFYQRTIGRMLGFSPAYGDPYCAMGENRIGDHPIAALAGVSLLPGTDLFRSARRVCAATLYRNVPAYRATVVPSTVDEEATVIALSESSDGRSTIAVCAAAGGEITVEYRVASGDDEGIIPAVVVHTVRVRHDAGWFETALPPVVGASAEVAGVRVSVREVGTDRVTVGFTR